MKTKETNQTARRWRFPAGFFPVLSILLALSLALVLLLPSMVAFTVNRILKQSAARGYIACDISQITLFSANASVHARQKTAKGRFRSVLSLPHCRITYSPLSLLRGRIDSLTITGATIPATVENGTVVFPLLSIFDSVRQEKEQKEKSAGSSSAGMLDLGTIRIENGALSLRFGRKVLYVPVSMTIRQEGSGWKKLLLHGRIHLNGQTIFIREAAVDTQRKEIRTSLRIRDAVLNNLPHPLDLYADKVGLQGELGADLLADFNYGTFQVRHFKSQMKIRNFSLLAGGKTIASDLFTCALEFNGKQGSLLLENLGIADLVQLNRSATEFELSGRSVSGTSSLEVTAQKPNRFDFTFSAAADPAAKSAELSIRSAEGRQYELAFGGIQGTWKSLALQLKASAEQQTARLLLDGAQVRASGKTASIKTVSLDARHAKGAVSGTLAGKIDRIEDPASSVTVRGVEFSIPFLRGGEAEGTIAAEAVSWKNQLTARVAAKTKISLSDSLRKDSAQITGSVVLPDYPGIAVRFRSSSRYENGVFLSRNSFELPESEIPAVDFRKFSGELADLQLSGKIRAAGSYVFGTDRAGEGKASVAVSGVNLKSPAHELSLEGGTLEFDLPSLPEMRSSPGRKASAQRIRFGGIDVRDVELFYRMESPTVWAVEAVKAAWASGVVRMEFTRLDFSRKSCELVLHCDRLNLSEILIQLGQKAVPGEGTLNGTLPVTISPGNIVFHDGFLNTTPGVTGSLKLTGTEYLTAGIPETIPQYAQLKFSQDVLKDFSYDWAKLNLSSKNDILTLQMKISGRPTRPLPYRYDGGQLVRINTLTTFAGVRLDVNFTLPLANVLNIINKFKKLSGGTQ